MEFNLPQWASFTLIFFILLFLFFKLNRFFGAKIEILHQFLHKLENYEEKAFQGVDGGSSITQQQQQDQQQRPLHQQQQHPPQEQNHIPQQLQQQLFQQQQQLFQQQLQQQREQHAKQL